MTDGTSLQLDALIRLRAAAHGLTLGARQKTLSAQAGGYVSAYRGRGMEFDEVRVYQAGDDARTIDWRVTARRGQPHTKLFREERERPVMFLVDLHPGMFFGSRTQFKSVLAGRLSALMGWAAVRAGDRVGGIVSSATAHREISPHAREQGLLPLLKAAVNLQPKMPGMLTQGRMDQALARMVRLVRPGSLVVIFSDFRELGEQSAKYLDALARHNDVVAAFLYDPLEAEAPPAGYYQLGMAEQRLTLDTRQTSVVKHWQEAFYEHHSAVRILCRCHAVHFMQIATTDNMVNALRMGLSRQGGQH